MTRRLPSRSFWGITLWDPKYEPQKGTTMEPMVKVWLLLFQAPWFEDDFCKASFGPFQGQRSGWGRVAEG